MDYHPGSCITAGEIKIPVISIATWKTNDEDMENALNTALELGYRRIRTSYAEYKALGSILKEMFASNKFRREDIFISAKLPSVGNRYEDVEYFLKKALDELQLDYLDLYELGSPMGFVKQGDTLVPLDDDGEILLDLKTDIIGTWKGLEEQVVAGRTRSIGLGCCNLSQVARILDSCTIRPVSLSIELHLYLQMKEVVSFCKKNGIAVTAVAPLGCPGLQEILGGFCGKKKIVRSPMKDPVVKEIAKKYNKRPMQVVLRFLIEYGVTIAFKSVNPKRLKECFDIFDFQLTREEYDRLIDLDCGEEGRLIGGSCGTGILKTLERHPEFPWKK
ncbi:unnamed protein product [Nezara viridula]|uniref:NADP-dependent oxidoreductase domain-containing protein n=1 Tax=Nezara viridula TaxID=85310 RepID=A0A9P0EC15_NEZVI|nr:unnamed protein product [Nezara viridula]